MEGILKSVSKYGGIMMDGREDWINATPEAKVDALKRLPELKSMEGSVVKLSMIDGKWCGIEVIQKLEKKVESKPLINAEDIRLKSMLLSYAKDMACAKIIDHEYIIDTTEKFYRYIKGE